MNSDILTEERIDNYLLGRMSDAEKAAFERELEENTDLREEYECQKEVAHAVQKVAMKEFLRQHSAQRQETETNVIDIRVLFKQASEKIQDFFSSGQRVVWTFASVAAMLVAIVGSFNYSSTLHSVRDCGLMAYSDLASPVARDGNETDALMEKVYLQIGENDYDVSLSMINDLRKILNGELSKDATSEEDIYEHQVLQQKIYELDWYEAIIQMKQGKVLKAKSLLERISQSESPYHQQASDILDSVF